MLKHISLLILTVASNVVYAQNTRVTGNFIEPVKNSDSVYIFATSNLNPRYYEKESFVSEVKDGKFSFEKNLSYPQLYRVRLRSENDVIPFRSGIYFIDNTSSTIKIGLKSSSSEVDGASGREYKDVFLPFLFRHSITNIDRALVNNGKEFDLILLKYVNEHPNSYVGLWFLICSFNTNGYFNVQSQILNSFSDEIRSGPLWKILKSEIDNIRIKIGLSFPDFTLLNTGLQPEKINLPTAEFTLIDYWFSRCLPCLEQLPQLKAMYKEYHQRGFNIIGISTDLTKDVKPYWQKRIIEHEIPWANYLDKNGKEAEKEKITSFPTNFLLNSQGKVIQKNISLDDLGKLLEVELAPAGKFYDPKRF